MMLDKEFVEITRIGISHLSGNFLNRHSGVYQHVFYTIQTVSRKILFVVLSKIPLEKTSYIFRGEMESICQNV